MRAARVICTFGFLFPCILAGNSLIASLFLPSLTLASISFLILLLLLVKLSFDVQAAMIIGEAWVGEWVVSFGEFCWLVGLSVCWLVGLFACDRAGFDERK